MTIVAWFSCGVTSAVATKLALDMYDDDVVPVYIKIDQVHEDNARFIADCENWFGRKIAQYQRDTYRSPLAVAERTRYLNGPYGARCTTELKRYVRKAVERRLQPVHQVFGFEFGKASINRAVRFKEQNPETMPLFPLIEKGVTKKRAHGILKAAKIEEPAMYKLGYENNNCIGCFKGGMGYWNKVRQDFPDIFEVTAKLERSIGASCIKGVYLDELSTNRGRTVKAVEPDCDSFCEIEFADVISPKTERILKNGKGD